LKDSKRGLGVVLGCRPHLMRLDARIGGLDAVAYPAFELALKGFETLAVTDCLNYGNPERENVMSEFVASLDGMNSICAKLEAPIISGNVSFYNETMGRNITSTPSTGLVGLRPSVESLPLSHFSENGDSVYVLRLPGFITGGAAQELAVKTIDAVGDLDAQVVADFIRTTQKLSNAPGVRATRAVGKFGLAYALARMSLEGTGAHIDPEGIKMIRGTADRASLFEEHLYEGVFAIDPKQAQAFEDAFSLIRTAAPTAELHRIGRTQTGRLAIGTWISFDTSTLEKVYKSSWGATFETLA
jgi:phosphoribosylformylglycinamidine (FGAM) synthase-like enzyme